MIHDPDVGWLADVATELKREYVEADGAWAGSPFAWIKAQPSPSRRGKIGERLVARWCRQHGFRVESVGDKEADMMVHGHRVEVKFSTCWEEDGCYKFQQIRDQDYAFLICLGLSPTSAHCWIIPKDVVFSKDVLFVYVGPQHGEKRKTRTRTTTRTSTTRSGSKWIQANRTNGLRRTAAHWQPHRKCSSGSSGLVDRAATRCCRLSGSPNLDST